MENLSRWIWPKKELRIPPMHGVSTFHRFIIGRVLGFGHEEVVGRNGVQEGEQEGLELWFQGEIATP